LNGCGPLLNNPLGNYVAIIASSLNGAMLYKDRWAGRSILTLTRRASQREMILHRNGPKSHHVAATRLDVATWLSVDSDSTINRGIFEVE
jgi:hypothetical protein